MIVRMSDTDDDDRATREFREAMRDVRRLPRAGKTARAVPKPPAKARFTRADQVEVLRESLLPPADEALLSTGDELSFRRPHVPDLHGMTGAEAKAALREFVAESLEQRWRCVRVVHGKGRRSGPRGPVLKNVVNHWLRRADDVLAFGSARAVDGGSGAIYVLLRAK